MSLSRPYGTRATPVPDVRPPQRARSRGTPPTMATMCPRPLSSLGVEKQAKPAQKPAPERDSISRYILRESMVAATTATTTTKSKFDVTTPPDETSNSESVSNVWGQEPVGSLLPVEVQTRLSTLISKQNSDWESRRCRLLEHRDRDLSRRRRKAAADSKGKSVNELAAPLCILLHSILAESRERWRTSLSSRVRELKREVRRPPRTVLTEKSNTDGSDGDDDVEWSVAHLYKTLVTGLNSTATEELLTSRIFAGDASFYHGSIDSFGLLTVFRAPIQELLAQHEVLAPGLTLLRRYFAALHPLNGCPKATTHTEPSANAAEENLEFFLQCCNNPEAVASALRGKVSPSLRRLLYARALQLPVIVTDGTSLFGGRGEFQENHHSDGIDGCLTFATKYSHDEIRRRMLHSYSTKEQEATAKVIQAIIKVDNAQCVGNSDKYFIFLEETEVLAFSLLMDNNLQDMHLKNTLQQMGRPSEQIDSYLVFLEDTPSEEDTVPQRRTPPSGFFPVRFSSLLAAPICYITGDTVEQYDLLSSLFGQLWCRLQGPTPELAQCCWIFESLVARFAATACLHATRTLGLPPLRLAIQWMVSAFVDVLEPAELLSFWDLILSYHVEEMFAERGPLSVRIQDSSSGMEERTDNKMDMKRKNGEEEIIEDEKKKKQKEEDNESPSVPCALWLLPLLAASLFVYRAPLVERCATAEDMMSVFKEGHHVRCRPLLQYLLFMAK